MLRYFSAMKWMQIFTPQIALKVTTALDTAAMWTQFIMTYDSVEIPYHLMYLFISLNISNHNTNASTVIFINRLDKLASDIAMASNNLSCVSATLSDQQR